MSITLLSVITYLFPVDKEVYCPGNRDVEKVFLICQLLYREVGYLI